MIATNKTICRYKPLFLCPCESYMFGCLQNNDDFMRIPFVKKAFKVIKLLFEVFLKSFRNQDIRKIFTAVVGALIYDRPFFGITSSGNEFRITGRL